jgi:signal transduction histidine kinase/putative methionine-R-sulfoxide reductase with GAF domain
MTATLDQEAVDPQQTIAELRRQLDECRAALAARDSGYGERIEQQSATIDVLRVMAGSPADPQPVFDLIAERARMFCDVDSCSVQFLEDGMLRLLAVSGANKDVICAFASSFPRPVNQASTSGRAMLTRKPVQIADVFADNEYDPKVTAGSHRSTLVVPILRGDVAIGVVGLGRPRPGGYSAAQVELLQTFAEQAVIAISSAETWRQLIEQRGETAAALDRQAALAAVMDTINRSPGDPAPVFDTILHKAHELCGADTGALTLYEDGLQRTIATHGLPEHFAARVRRPFRPSVGAQGLIGGKRYTHIPDIRAIEWAPDQMVMRGLVEYTQARTRLSVPMRKDGVLLGMISANRSEVRPFSEQEIVLLESFANQAVIALENTRLLSEQREALEQQTATAEVLQVINESHGDLTPVFDAILEKAVQLCGPACGGLSTFDGEYYHVVSMRDYPPEYAAFLRQPWRSTPGGFSERILRGGEFLHIADVAADKNYLSNSANQRALCELGGARTVLWIGLRNDNALIGLFTLYRQEVRPFTDKEIALVRSFAAHAVIAMENARLITEQREALDQQTATAEVLQVINASPGDVRPVFDAMLERAIRLCGPAFGVFSTFDGSHFHSSSMRGITAAWAEHLRRPFRPSTGGRLESLIQGAPYVHVEDIAADKDALAKSQNLRAMFEHGGARTSLFIAMRRDKTLVGQFCLFRPEVRAFSNKEIAMLENFAAQAVIAMESARLLQELRARTDELAQRQNELRVTFENMGGGVAMFDETQHLVAWNRKFQDILDVPDDIIARRQTFTEYVRYLAERGEYGPEADPEEQIRRLTENAGKYRAYERARPDGRVIEIRHNPVPGGGFVLIYADITERKRSEAEIAAARDAAEEDARTIEAAFRELKTAQANLIQAEKMASLGQLTAGIAHEIKNPLNFVNNFAELAVDLLGELKEAIAPAEAVLTEDQRDEVDDVVATLTSNLEKITEHGKRADGIVKAMLEHSRGASGERREADINQLTEEALNLAYHGARAQDQSFNITLERDFGDGIAPIELNPQEMTRVLLNLFSNGFYAASQRASSGEQPGFDPTLRVTTRAAGDAVEIRVRDNGTGIPADIRDKLFQPFFTTKPSGQGTGLGLSITYDIVTKAHGGTIAVDSEVDAFTEFIVTLPRGMFANEGSRA